VNVASAEADPESLLQKMQSLIAVRKSQPTFAIGDSQFLAQAQTQCLVLLRSYQHDHILCIHNLSNKKQILELDLSEFTGRNLFDLINKSDFKIINEDHMRFTIDPYGFNWLKIK
jgi:glycosidase